MPHLSRRPILCLVALWLVVFSLPVVAQSTLVRITDGPGGVGANASCTLHEYNGGAGQFVADGGGVIVFRSSATNLTTSPSNGQPHIFAHDANTGVNEVVSCDSNGVQGNGASYWGVVSADGRYVAFTSFATNLVPGDTNAHRDAFLRDRVAGTTEICSVSSAGVLSNGSTGTLANTNNVGSVQISISGDGSRVVFNCYGSNLVAGDTNGVTDVFVRDRLSGTTARVSQDVADGQLNGASTGPSISRDGNWVAFECNGTNAISGDPGAGIFVKHLPTGVVERVNVGPGGVHANDFSVSPSVSADGRFIVYRSRASNLVSGDTNGGLDVFLRDRLAGTTERVSVTSAGVQAPGQSAGNATVSDDGRFVTFDNDSPLASNDLNAFADIYLRDRLLNSTTCLSVDMSRTAGSGFQCCVARDGSTAAFAGFGLVTPDPSPSFLDVYTVCLQGMPSIVGDPADQLLVCPQASASFSVAGAGSGLSYQWRRSGVPLSNGGSVAGATTSTLLLSSVSVADAGAYDCVVANACGSVVSGGANLTVDVADADGDLTPDCSDGCPNDSNKTAPGACGCGTADTDTDGDSTPDCNDACPNDPAKIVPGQCGCGTPDTDTDGDGTADCNDGCVNDPAKIAPGDCGCGTPDTDTDGDGTADCNDGCVNDPLKIAPGQCGCGTPDTDTDGDGTADCNDGCPNDPNKIAVGQCGCGTPDTDTDGDTVADCNDNCDTISNPLQEDCNQNGIGDVCDIASGFSKDTNVDLIPDDCQGSGVEYCFGDGSGAPCPCANLGGFKEGCKNSSPQGARLYNIGGQSFALDDAVLTTIHMPTNKFGLVFMGKNQISAPFGDGRLCVSTQIKRFSVKNSGATGSFTQLAPIANSGATIVSGSTWNFQTWYRDPAGPCSGGYNLSSAVQLTFN